MEPLKNPFFKNITQKEYDEMIKCGGIRVAEFKKNGVIFHTGDITEEFGIILSGEVHIENIDLWGNRVILHSISDGQAFGETYAFCKERIMIDVTAVRDSEILFVNIGLLQSSVNYSRSWYNKMLYNLLVLSTEKNLAWSSRVFCITAKSIRSRVMTYLSSEAVKRGTTEFNIPFDRQQMADYLNVERSALSKELGKMKKEGILTFQKNRFKLYQSER